jgi:hypothetical protein
VAVQAPALSFQVPRVYRDEPLLIGRARVEFVVEKSSGASKFVDSVEGGTSSRSAFEITLDGYSAPVTAGKFAKLVRDGKFDSMQWSSGYLTLLTGKGADPGATLPLEILPTGVLCCDAVLLDLPRGMCSEPGKHHKHVQFCAACT